MSLYKFLRLLFLFIPVSFLISTISLAQTDSSYLQTEEVLENILQEPVGEVDNSDLIEDIDLLLKNPINLNRATFEDLQIIPGIDINTAKIIIDHRNKYGNFFSVNELNAVQNLNKKVIEGLSPFLFVEKPAEIIVKDQPLGPFENFMQSSNILLRSRIINSLQTNKGFNENKFEGTKPKVYNRLLIRYNRQFQIGYLAEKDAGEKQLNEFSTYHLAINDLGIIHKAVVLDYLLEFGQGLTLWSPYAFLKGADAVYPVKRTDRILRPYTSSTENNFFRGGAAAIKFDNFIFSAFYSNNYFDANIDSLTGKILSTPEDGLHRTFSEIRKRKTAREKMFGGRIDFISERFLSFGFLHYRSKFSNDFESSSVFDFSGKDFNYTAFYYNLYFDKLNFSGEFSYNGTSVASINIMQLALSSDFTFITSIRSYPRNYFSFHGFGFGERSGTTSNEFGIYAGFRWRTKFGLINFYYDQFKFPFATFFNPQPSNGDEFLVDYLSRPINKFETRIRYKYEKKDVPEMLNNTKQLVKRLRQILRLELIYSISNIIRLKGRFEYNSFKVSAIKSKEKGYLIFQDIRFAPVSNLNLYGRIIFFKTDSFNSAIYEYENNLTGVLTNIPLFGEGMRWYILLRYKIFKYMALSFKYAETYKPKEKKIGSGNTQIPLNLDNVLSIQLDLNI
ncbi:MAG: helix-hairpin-helix domain-containing protein [Ignavibacteria bacterium]|nr:helix-hairpin-helix domain-containing protein [Ignavibacteria bacterium]